jgi:hypothetical protein
MIYSPLPVLLYLWLCVCYYLHEQYCYVPGIHKSFIALNKNKKSYLKLKFRTKFFYQVENLFGSEFEKEDGTERVT